MENSINPETCKWAINELENLRELVVDIVPTAVKWLFFLEKSDANNHLNLYSRAKIIADRIQVSPPSISTEQNYKQELWDWCDKYLDFLRHGGKEISILTEKQRKILKYLNEKKIAVANADIEMGADISKNTVSDEIAILKKCGYIAPPTGKKKLVGITQKGIDHLKTI